MFLVKEFPYGADILSGVDILVVERMIGACIFFEPSKLASELILLFGAHALSSMDLLITALDEQTEDW